MSRTYPHITVRVWEGDYGVPSVDPKCLQILGIFKINKVDVAVRHAYFPQWTAIPSIQHDKTTVTETGALLSSALDLCSTSTNETLTTSLQSRLKAYEKYFMDHFANTFYFDCWVNDANYEHAIKTWYNNVVPFPFNYFYLKRAREAALEHYTSLLGVSDPDTFRSQQLANCSRCLEDFASLLEDGRPYFLGDTPTSLDAIIYGYLTVALNMPLPDSQLQNIIKNHHLLVRFVRHFAQQYFPNVSTGYKYVEPVNNSNDRASTKSLIIAGLCVTTAMFLYACSIGLIKPRFGSLGQITDVNIR